MPPEPVKILAVDDIDENLVALEALLRREDVQFITARSGVEALEALLVHDIALALLDVQMPGMDGFELAELMRGTERTRRVPIIFVTAAGPDERRTFRGYGTGAVDYLFKPLDPHIVRSKVDIFVELCRQRQELARQRDDHAAALAKLHAHHDNSPLAYVEIGPDQRITAWSDSAERLFGWRLSEVAGFRPDDLEWLDAAHAGAFGELIGGMIAGHRPRAVHAMRMRNAVGLTLEVECYCSALLDAAGRLASIGIQILDVTERKRAEETQRLLIGELNHRVKNTLASVQAIASQTLRHSTGPSDFAPTFIGRIHALARAHSLLSATTWQGASLRELVEGQLLTGTVAASQLVIEGPDIDLAPEPALHLALVLHELVTNAHKYGALSVPGGTASLRWTRAKGQLLLEWQERGGPPVAAPQRRGFGSALIERSLRAEGGGAEAEFAPEGLTWRLRLPSNARMHRAPKPIVAEPIAARPTDPLSLTGKRILIVEDEPLVALELGQVLNDAGAVVIGPAASAAHALALIGTEPVDAALLDGNLQGEMVDAIALALQSRGVPFLFVSGYGRDHLPAGFDAVPIVAKPFAAPVLIAAAAALFADAPAAIVAVPVVPTPNA